MFWSCEVGLNLQIVIREFMWYTNLSIAHDVVYELIPVVLCLCVEFLRHFVDVFSYSLDVGEFV